VDEEDRPLPRSMREGPISFVRRQQGSGAISRGRPSFVGPAGIVRAGRYRAGSRDDARGGVRHRRPVQTGFPPRGPSSVRAAGSAAAAGVPTRHPLGSPSFVQAAGISRAGQCRVGSSRDSGGGDRHGRLKPQARTIGSLTNSVRLVGAEAGGRAGRGDLKRRGRCRCRTSPMLFGRGRRNADSSTVRVSSGEGPQLAATPPSVHPHPHHPTPVA
jgi:hypothetical protein